MINVAIVEDDDLVSSQLKEFFNKISAEYGKEFSVNIFKNAVVFLQSFKSQFDIVLMDIEMPHINGMDAAVKMREIDDIVTLIFVTNMQQYAVKGYEVKALDFIVKPVYYETFAMKINRAMREVAARQNDFITVKSRIGVVRIAISDLAYVEVARHNLTFHMVDGTVEARGNISDVESELAKYHFLRCNVCYLVNPKYIKKIAGNTICIIDRQLQISRPKKKKFLENLARYFEVDIK